MNNQESQEFHLDKISTEFANDRMASIAPQLKAQTLEEKTIWIEIQNAYAAGLERGLIEATRKES